MGTGSIIENLPPEKKQWADDWLVSHNFKNYQQFEEEAKAQGIEVSKSSAGRYGLSFKKKLDQIKIATEQARAVVKASPDDHGGMNEALASLVQTNLFQMMSEFRYDPEEPVDIAKITSAVATLSRAQVNQKKWRIDLREKAERAASAVEQVARKGGLSAEAANNIRGQILGIAA
uniref:Phage terminase, small subunit n=1 Tax=Candidatus Kentrum sp. UNK TaxID=2126344 RepID=A0A451B437_9GAMM|nr:MAG: Protein of unknown function (DUF3486) [Candidatus Kentron sp. UNK]VFK73051.1 MAG: Protein of unknown function (DUF3486) [Candidatus Kentron sp. UNK]